MSDQALVFAVILLLGLLVVAMRIQARASAKPRKELHLRPRGESDAAAQDVPPVSPASAEPVLKLPRKTPKP